MVDKLSEDLRFNQDALRLRAYRQQVITANIANADTPGYKARDFDFSQVLSRAVGQADMAGPVANPVTDVALARTSPRHLAGQAAPNTGLPGPAELLYRVPQQPSLDGNTVELDAERVKFADNAVHYQAGLTVLGNQIKTMLAAIEQNN